MAQNLLNHMLNNPHLEAEFHVWLFEPQKKPPENAFQSFECTQIEFITHFLNVLHEQSEKQLKSVETPTRKLSKSFTFPVEHGEEPRKKPAQLNSSLSSASTPLQLGDFITTPRRSVGNGKKVTPRRIKPTNVAKNHSPFHQSENSFDFTSSPPAATANSPDKFNRSLKNEQFNFLTSTPKKQPHLQQQPAKADPDLVSHTTEINLLVRTYCKLIRANFVLNLNSEIYFLVTLLQWNHEKNSDNTIAAQIQIDTLFQSIHSIVYFAANCLDQLKDVLVLVYDKNTVKLLSENERLIHFQPGLRDYLQKHETNEALTSEQTIAITSANVCFDTETDNRENFPNEATFHAFRKQRDLFYEILRLWEQQHFQPHFAFTSNLGGKVKALFTLSCEPISLQHLARLFKNQLLLNVLNGGGELKINRLTNRCLNKAKGNEQQFNDTEEFFMEFILVANALFLQHLDDCFQLEMREILQASSESTEKAGALNLRPLYVKHLKSLMVLGKFLGFLHGLPYKTELKYSEIVLKLQIEARKAKTCKFALVELLESGISASCLVLIVPFLAKYLSQLDFVSFHMEYHRKLTGMLFDLYKNATCKWKLNEMLIKLSLGWLFELPHFPSSCFYNSTPKTASKRANRKGLDSLNLVDLGILRIACPQIENVKKLLVSRHSASNFTRHITPLTALQSPGVKSSRNQLEAQLEETFLSNSLPSSTRKTMEFVSERIASSCVKHICHTLVPKHKKRGVELFRAESGGEKQVDTKEFAAKLLQEFNKVCRSEVNAILDDKIGKAIEALLPLDDLTQTKLLCVKITKKMCLERVNYWTNLNITLNVFHKDIHDESTRKGKLVAKKPKFSLTVQGGAQQIDGNVCSAAKISEKLCETTADLIENGELNADSISKLFTDCLDCFKLRNDVNQVVTSTICSQFVDLSIVLLSLNFKFDGDLTHLFTEICKFYHQQNTDDLFRHLLSTRNILILSQSSDLDGTWSEFAAFCTKLLDFKLMSYEVFEEQCTAIWRHDWDEGMLNRITSFFKACLALNPSASSQFNFLLAFLSDYCDNLGCFD